MPLDVFRIAEENIRFRIVEIYGDLSLYNSSCCSEAQLHFHKNKETEPKHGTAMECHG